MVISSDQAYLLSAIQFIKACLAQHSFEEAFQCGHTSVSDQAWTPQTESILKVLFAVEEYRSDILETAEALEIFAEQAFDLYKKYKFSGKTVTLATTILSFDAVLFWNSIHLNKLFQERYHFFQEKFKKMGASEVVSEGRRYINMHRSAYMQERSAFGKRQLDRYLADQLSIGNSFEKELGEDFSAANTVIAEEEQALETALVAGKDAIDSHYTEISDQNIANYRAYENQVEEAKRQMKKKKRRGIFRAIVGVVAGIIFAPILAPNIFVGATGLGLLIGEGAILGAITAAISKQNILKGATISAFFAGFSELFGGFLLEHLKKFKILRESLKIAAMASLQTAIQRGKFIDHIISGVGAEMSAKLLASRQKLGHPRLSASEMTVCLKDAALQGMMTSGVVALIRGTTVEKTAGSIGMGMLEAAASRLGRRAANELNAVATSDDLKTWFVEATETYLSRQEANIAIESKHFPNSFTTRQIADASSSHQSQNNQSLRQRFPMLAAFSDAMQVQQAHDKKLVAGVAKKGDDFLEKCHQLLQAEAERRGRRGEYLPQYGLKAVEIVLPSSILEATAIAVAGPAVRVVGRGAVLTHRWIVAERGANRAFKGGKYAGHIPSFRAQGHRQLRKTVRSYGEQIKYHEGWLKNPQSKCADWKGLHLGKRIALKFHWRKDILRLATYREMSQRILREKERALVIIEKMKQAARAAREAQAEKTMQLVGTVKQTGAKYGQ